MGPQELELLTEGKGPAGQRRRPVRLPPVPSALNRDAELSASLCVVTGRPSSGGLAKWEPAG